MPTPKPPGALRHDEGFALEPRCEHAVVPVLLRDVNYATVPKNTVVPSRRIKLMSVDEFES
jgi:hypothetical protein